MRQGPVVRGRVGATGAAFNLGEMTVTRASVRLASGNVGHAFFAEAEPGGFDGVIGQGVGLTRLVIHAGLEAEACGAHHIGGHHAEPFFDVFVIIGQLAAAGAHCV